jgi:pyruvate dehydrogenase E2 component (dihydrolipoamide acetyltransferase)
MAVEIPMPRLSQTTDEVRLIRWLVKEGDRVRKGQALCEVENDKNTMEVESFAAGTVLCLAGQPDSVISAGTVIAVLGEPGERAVATSDAAVPPRAPAAASSAGQPAPAGPAAVPPSSAIPLPSGVRATPLVRNLARKHGVDLAQVRGTGARGLITREDLDAWLRDRAAGTAVAAVAAGEAAAASATVPPPAAAQPAPGGRPRPAAAQVAPAPSSILLSVHQKAVARAVTAAKTQVPHYYLKIRVFADRLLAWRAANRRADGSGVAIDALLVWASARALLGHPRLNGTFGGERILASPQANIGVAVAVGEELHVPVIRQAESKDIQEIDRELASLAAKAQAGRLELADLAGGTFTLTNLGMYPVEEFAAVLNAPQLAILAAGRIRKELAVAEDESLRVRAVLTLTGSFDHRAVNGAQGAAFLAEIKRILEEEL